MGTTGVVVVKKEDELRYFDNPLCRANFSYGDDIQEVDDDDEDDYEADKKDLEEEEKRDTIVRFTPKPPSEPKPIAIPPPLASPKRMSLIWKRTSFTSFGEH